ncbi:MAG: zinc-ribbon domain-containing protein [Oscillospiraceae bacterium]|nr:zinc-ribbon domain-containing protein [Oscillospiraceae bacterium]
MESFRALFGTVKPVEFREFDSDQPHIDLDMEVRVAGKVEVSDYNPALYSSQDEVKTTIRDNTDKILWEVFFQEWPGGKSVMRSDYMNEVAKLIDKRLAARGIIGETEIVNFFLTPESEEKYKEAREIDISQLKFYDDVQYRPQIQIGMPVDPSFMGMGGLSPHVQPDIHPMTPEEHEEAEKKRTPLKFCPNCGEKLSEGLRFCPNCGEKF